MLAGRLLLLVVVDFLEVGVDHVVLLACRRRGVRPGVGARRLLLAWPCTWPRRASSRPGPASAFLGLDGLDVLALERGLQRGDGVSIAGLSAAETLSP
jgi:hypothetical protein